MSVKPAPKGRSGWPLGLIGMLAIVAAVERHVAHRGHGDFGTMYSLEWGFKGRAIGREAADARLLCFGTSLTRLGVSPVVLERRLGLPSYNCGLSGGQPFAIYTAFRHALAAGSRPAAVVVEYKWTALRFGPAFNERILPELATLGECGELALAARDADLFTRMTLVKLLPSYRCRDQVRDNVAAALGGREPARNYERFIDARNMRINRGAFHTPKSKYDGRVDPGDGDLFPASWTCDPVSESYIDRFLDLAEGRQIPVFWLIPPTSPAVVAGREEVGAEAAYTRFVKAVTARHPGVAVIDARDSAYPLEAFWDATHLNRDGAVALSDDLADAIAGRLARPGPEPGLWVGLPRYRKNARAAEVEDVTGTIAFFDKKRMKSAPR